MMLSDEFTGVIESAFTQTLTQHGSTLVVAVAILTLWLLGKLVTSAQRRLAQKPRSPETLSLGVSTELPQGIHVSGLTQTLLEELKKLVQKKDKLKLAVFFAVHQPTIQEVESLLESIEIKQDRHRDELAEFITGSENLKNTLRSENPDTLNHQDIELIREHNKNEQKLINKSFVSKFGNLLFMENFIIYNHLCRNDPAIFYIPRDNELRRMFETFVNSGIAAQGLAIPLAERLHILKLKEMQKIAYDMKINKVFHSVDEAIDTLARIPKTAVRLASRYPSSDLFLLRREDWDISAVTKEWSVYNAYAKLLCVTPD